MVESCTLCSIEAQIRDAAENTLSSKVQMEGSRSSTRKYNSSHYERFLVIDLISVLLGNGPVVSNESSRGLA